VDRLGQSGCRPFLDSGVQGGFGNADLFGQIEDSPFIGLMYDRWLAAWILGAMTPGLRQSCRRAIWPSATTMARCRSSSTSAKKAETDILSSQDPSQRVRSYGRKLVTA
jgi:hypothetical protein